MKNMKLFKPFLTALLFVVMGFAQAELVIDFNDSSGFGTAMDLVQINNIRVDTRTEIVNPFDGTSQFHVITMYYDVPFRFEQAAMHLVPDMSGAAPQTPERNCAQLTVFVTNAMNGDPITDATATVGGISKHTGVSGAIFDGLPTGLSSVQVTHQDFVADSKTVNLACGNNGTVSLSLSPSVGEDALQANDMRLILTWGEQPVDLDAHLTCPVPGLPAGFTNEEGRDHVYWPPELRSGCDGMVNLDVDDTSSFGPETITIVPNPATGRLNEGIYRYSVYQYQGFGTLADSASVSLIVGNYPTRTFYPPLLCQGSLTPSGDMAEAVELGNIWKVLELHVDAAGIVSVVEVNTCGQEAGSAVVRKTIR
jgi:hypothetical protein